MTPQHSCLPWRPFRYGMTAKAYICMECHATHICAIYSRLNSITFRSTIPALSAASRLIRYCFHIFESRLWKCTPHLPKFRYFSGGNQNLLCSALHSLDPPGDPPWCKFSNYLNTKNRPFFNPSSWAVPMTRRSSERK